MSNKAGASKKRPQQLKKNPKRKTDDEEVELPERKVMKILSLSFRTLWLKISSVLCEGICED